MSEPKSARETAAGERLDAVVASVLGSAKYRGISPDLVRDVATRELARRASLKEASKATKNKLHQIAGVYLEGRPSYEAWLAAIARAADDGDPETLRDACRAVMRHHASTRERLPILDQFYASILAGLPAPSRVLDLACGLNPLAAPWLPLARGAEYRACDVYADLIAFVGGCLERMGVSARAEVRDVLRDPPRERADLALLLKAIPCLEQLDPDAGHRLLRAIDAPYVIVSYPVHSLGGRGKGMAATYEARFRALVAGEGWTIQRFAFSTELAFLIIR